MTHCPVHNQPWKTVPGGVSRNTGRPYNAFQACPIQGCKERPQRAYTAPQASYAPTAYKPDRNYDKEAYEKCCSIWIAAMLNGHANANFVPPFDDFWHFFQAIRADGEKRFATGMDRARAILQTPQGPIQTTIENEQKLNTYSDDFPPIEAYMSGPQE